MDPVVARNEIEPLLSELIRQLSAAGRATEQAIFVRIRQRLCEAQSPAELLRPINDLSTMAGMRRDAPNDAGLLLDRILEKAAPFYLQPDASPIVH